MEDRKPANGEFCEDRKNSGQLILCLILDPVGTFWEHRNTISQSESAYTSSLLGVMKAQQPEKQPNKKKIQKRKMVLGEHLKAQALVKILWKIRG